MNEMRNFRDAKAMAQSLREVMSAKQISLAHGEALEMVSTMLGFADWNTLSAFIKKDRSTAKGSAPNTSRNVFPTVPMKDLVPFPAMQMIPIWVRREKTVQAITNAFSRRRELVVVAQKSQTIEEPRAADIFDVGVVARVLDVGPPSEKAISANPELQGATQVLVQMQARVAIRRFSSDGGVYEAEVDYLDEGDPSAVPPGLIEEAATRFDSYATARGINTAGMGIPLRQLHDPGRVADIIASRLSVSIEEKQALLAALDPVARLEGVIAQMAA
jgi:ATP-dependent Lon protease